MQCKETRREQLRQAELLHRTIDAEIKYVQSILNRLSFALSQYPETNPQSAHAHSQFNPNQPRGEDGRWLPQDGQPSPQVSKPKPQDGQSPSQVSKPSPPVSKPKPVSKPSSQDSPPNPPVSEPKPEPGGKSGMDIDKAVAYLDENADPEPPGKQQCAIYVKNAMRAGGIKVPNGLGSAKNYENYLRVNKFDELPPDENYPPKKGDIVVFQPPNAKHSDGHIQMYNGKQWVSDFVQPRRFWPGKDYENLRPRFSIFRP